MNRQLRRIDRVLAQWSDREISAMRGPEADAIAELCRLRRELLCERGTRR